MKVWDAEGNEYVDLVGGIAVNVLGHAHPALVEAVSKQIATLGHTSNLYTSERCIELAETLLDLTQDPSARVFFCNSGTEANELAFKIARLTNRTKIVTAVNSFHGRTMGALALTGQTDKQEPFRPLPGDVTHVPFGDVGALEKAIDRDVAALVLEPIQGEAGVIVPPDGYLRAAREITARSGTLLMIDEVQTGMGRTGTWFAYQQGAIQPDVVMLAKGLGGGFPIGACIVFGDTTDLLKPGLHGSTFGGNPTACAAALAVINVISVDNLMGNAIEMGERLMSSLNDLDHPMIREVRGRGLLVAIELSEGNARQVQAEAQVSGFLVNAIGNDTIRLAPPLIISSHDVDNFVKQLPAILSPSVDPR